MSDTPAEREPGGPWGQLYRRKIVQWAIAYAAAAWTLLQVIEYLAETYDWPPAIRQIAVPVLSLGSLFVLVLAWYHGDKGEQKASRQELALLASLLLTAGGVMWWFVARLDANAWLPASAGVVIPHAVPTDAPSVAVLPFVNMSSDPEQEYFADGLSEEILNSLARIPGLFVPARTSSFQFKGKAGDVAKFAALLGVAHVLEGSVRKSGGRVRITAQLISAADGYHVWSQTYDRELTDIFAIQTEISDAIADALKIRLTAQQKLAAATTAPTANLEAYEAYLLGRHAADEGRWRSAREHFERAIGLDPQFADALANLGMAIWNDRETYSPSWEAQDKARRLVEAALALDPRSAEVLQAAGFMAKQDGRFDQALAYVDASLAINPSDAEVLLQRYTLLVYLDRFEPGLETLREAVRRDPLSTRALVSLIRGLVKRGRDAETPALLERLRELNEVRWLGLQAGLALDRGDLAGSFRHLLSLYDFEPQRAKEDMAQVFCVLRLRAEFVANLPEPDRPLAIPLCFGDLRSALQPVRAGVTEEFPFRLFLLGDVLYGLGQFAEANEVFERAWKIKTAWPTWGLGSERLMMAADAARRVGATERAQSYRDWAERFLGGYERDGLDPGQYFMAMLRAYDGRDDDATRHLVAAIEKQDAWLDFRDRALLAHLAARPEVQEAIRRRQAALDLQRAEVLKMLCGPNPVSKHYQPAPETCATVKSP